MGQACSKQADASRTNRLEPVSACISLWVSTTGARRAITRDPGGHHPKTDIVEQVERIVPVTVGAAHDLSNKPERPAAQRARLA